MRTFRFYPPSPEDQRAFFAQLLGALLGVVVIGVLAWRTPDTALRGVLIGAGIATIFLLARGAWKLEQKAARAQRGEISVRADGFAITDGKAQTQFVSWQKIELAEVRGGRLYLAWRDEKNRKQELEIGSREIEDGMELIRLLAARGASTPVEGDAFTPPPNFISLEPK